jgi:hypothetical protein
METRKRSMPLEIHVKFVGNLLCIEKILKIDHLPASPHGRQRDEHPEIPKSVWVCAPHFLAMAIGSIFLHKFKSNAKPPTCTHLAAAPWLRQLPK